MLWKFGVWSAWWGVWVADQGRLFGEGSFLPAGRVQAP